MPSEELIELGNMPLISTDSEALMVTLPALPVAKVEELIAPPSRRISLEVLISTFPALPSRVGEDIWLGMTVCGLTPIN